MSLQQRRTLAVNERERGILGEINGNGRPNGRHAQKTYEKRGENKRKTVNVTRVANKLINVGLLSRLVTRKPSIKTKEK